MGIIFYIRKYNEPNVICLRTSLPWINNNKKILKKYKLLKNINCLKNLKKFEEIFHSITSQKLVSTTYIESVHNIFLIQECIQKHSPHTLVMPRKCMKKLSHRKYSTKMTHFFSAKLTQKLVRSTARTLLKKVKKKRRL